MPSRRRNYIIMVKLATTKRVDLPRTFHVKHITAIKNELADNVTIERRY